MLSRNRRQAIPQQYHGEDIGCPVHPKKQMIIDGRQDPTDGAAVASLHNVIEARHTERQTTLLVRVNGHLFDSSWEVQDVSLEDIVLAYMDQSQQQQQLRQRLDVQPALESTAGEASA